VNEVESEEFVETFWQDVRFSVRMLAKNPGFTAAAVLCLMLGIGATTGIFSVVNAVLLRPLPYAHPEQLIRVYTEFPTFPNGGLHRFWASGPEFLSLRRDTKSWSTLDAWITSGANIAGETQPVRITSGLVSGGLLESLGITPALGRVISPSDDLPGATRVADISYGTWQSVFGGDPNIVGRETTYNGVKCVIIGVMKRGFEFPPGEIDPPQIWTPLQIDPASPGSPSSHSFYLLGRLKNGVTASQAQSELSALVQAYGEKKAPKTHAFAPANHTLVSFPLQAEVVSSVRPALLMLLGAVAFVLLIACVNVANLLLARAEARRREIAIRSALGANLGRLARQFATEGVLLSFIGAILGLGLAFGGLRLIQLTNAGGLPRAAEIGMDWRVLIFTLGTSIVTGILFGLAPFFPLFFEQLTDSLKNTAGSTTGGSGAQMFRRILVAGELALALVLLIGCGLMVRAFWKLQEVHTGLNPQNVITMRIALPRATYAKNEQADAFFLRLEERLRQLPGVESAALVSGLAPQRAPNMNDTDIEGFVKQQNGPIQNVDYYQNVSKDYFSTMGIRLMAGRLFNDRDIHGAPDVVIINQTMARTFWPGQDPVGRRIRPGMSDPWCTIVGIVDDVKNAGLDRPTGTEIYLPFLQPQGSGNRNMYAILRGKGDPRSLSGAVRQEMNSIDPALPLSQIRLMDDVLSAAQSRPRFLTLLLALFSCVALAIATIGIYGVISYSVERRSREFGLRMALGAQPSDVLSLVMKQGAGLALIGVVVGLVAAYALTRLMTTLLFGVTPTDPATFAIVTAILTVVALAASYIPARRATKVDPIQTLRYE
jgi:putative ABC transport system permease protein